MEKIMIMGNDSEDIAEKLLSYLENQALDEGKADQENIIDIFYHSSCMIDEAIFLAGGDPAMQFLCGIMQEYLSFLKDKIAIDKNYASIGYDWEGNGEEREKMIFDRQALEKMKGICKKYLSKIDKSLSFLKKEEADLKKRMAEL